MHRCRALRLRFATLLRGRSPAVRMGGLFVATPATDGPVLLGGRTPFATALRGLFSAALFCSGSHPCIFLFRPRLSGVRLYAVRCIFLVFRRLGLHGVQLCMHFRGYGLQCLVSVGSVGTGCALGAVGVGYRRGCPCLVPRRRPTLSVAPAGAMLPLREAHRHQRLPELLVPLALLSVAGPGEMETVAYRAQPRVQVHLYHLPDLVFPEAH